MTHRIERRNQRREAVIAGMGPDDVEAALDLLELIDLAWHDCYGETPPDDLITEVLFVGRGDLGQLVSAAHLAVIDRRDLHMQALAIRDAVGENDDGA